MVSFGMFTPRALSTAVRNRGLPLMSPPSRAETVISLITLVQTFDFLESEASFLCLILDHRLWPDMRSFVALLRASRANFTSRGWAARGGPSRRRAGRR